MSILSYSGAAVLAVVFLAAHIPFLPASLEDLDSINFALGVRQFDVASHQPHPPGYPIFIAAAKIVHLVISPEAKALGLLSALAGALSVLALFALFRALDPGPRSARWSLVATLVTATAPLYWFTAARPLSDMPGLAAALAVQAMTLSAASGSDLALASFLAALAAGVRSQAVWLTVPLLALVIARRPPQERIRTGVTAIGAFVAGGLVWALPLVALSGGPGSYWRVLFNQGAADLTGVRMLSTTPTLRQAALALYGAFVAPWAAVGVAGIVIALAIAGVVGLYRDARTPLVTLAVAFAPYLVFDLLFQETATTRYALPLVPPIAYLAVRAGARFERPWLAALVALSVFNLTVGAPAVYRYSRTEAPAFRLLADMGGLMASRPAESPPLLGMHRRENFDFRRPIVWLGTRAPRFAGRLSAPPKREWLEMVKFWSGGGRGDVWFVADPLRTDLALIDHGPGPDASYRWPLANPVLIGGIRPDTMDWYRIHEPGWFLGEGWALTPETAGVAEEDGRGPGRAPIQGWIRRRAEETTLMFGGRNLSVAGPSARVRIAIDGRTIDEQTAPPGFFLRMLQLPAGSLEGSGEYATMTISADQPNVAIEQFDAQSAGRLVFGFGEGWHEPEYNPAIGRQWRWTSDRATLRVNGVGRPLVLRLAGDLPSSSMLFSTPSHVKISAGGREVASETLPTRFDVQVPIPADLVAGPDSTITIETDQFVVPAERSRRSPDRRRLGLRVFECGLRPAS